MSDNEYYRKRKNDRKEDGDTGKELYKKAKKKQGDRR